MHSSTDYWSPTQPGDYTIKIQVFFALLVIILMAVYDLSRLERVAIILVILAVLILESLNTIFEHLADILKPRLHDYIMIIKDTITN